MFIGTYRIAILWLAIAVLVLGACETKPGSEMETVAKTMLAKSTGAKLLVHSDLKDDFSSLKGNADALETNAAILAALKGSDERKLEAAMLAAKIELIAIPMDADEGFAPLGSLAEAFTNSGDFSLFSQVYMSGDVVLVKLTDAAFRVKEAEYKAVIAYVRAGLSGQTANLPAVFAQAGSFPAYVEVRVTDPTGNVKQPGVASGKGDSPKAALDAATRKAKDRVAKAGLKPSEAWITVKFQRELGQTTLRGRDLDKQFALGMDGLHVVIPKEGKGSDEVWIQPEKDKIYRVKNLGDLMEKAMKNAKLDKSAWKGGNVKLEKFRTFALTELNPGGEVVRLVRGLPYVDPDTMEIDDVRTAFKTGADWLLANFDTKRKMFKYEYYATRNQWRTNRYNIIRHGLATLTLIQAYELYQDERFLNAAQLAIEWVLELTEYEGDMAYFAHKRYDPKYKLGGTGVMVQAMTEFYRFKKMPEWDKAMKGYGNFMVHLQEENGHYKSFYTKPGEKEIDREVTIYPGEANLALVRLYLLYGDKTYLDTVEKAFKYYSKWFNKKKSPKRKGDLGAFVPWDMAAMSEYYEIVKRDDVAEYAYQMADWVLDNWYVWGPKQTYWKDLVGGFHGARSKTDIPLWNSGVYGEGIVGVYRIAKAKGDAKALEKYRRATFLTIRFIRNLQYRNGSTYFLPDPDDAIGGIASNYQQDDCRLDYAYHCLTVNYRAIRFFDADDWKAVGVTPPAK